MSVSICNKEKVSKVECHLKEKTESASWNVIESAWYMGRGSISGTKVFEVRWGIICSQSVLIMHNGNIGYLLYTK